MAKSTPPSSSSSFVVDAAPLLIGSLLVVSGTAAAALWLRTSYKQEEGGDTNVGGKNPVAVCKYLPEEILLDDIRTSYKQEEGGDTNVGGKNPVAVCKYLPEEILLDDILPYLDVVSLIQKKPVCKMWQELCTKTIDYKCHGKKKKFNSNRELKDAVNKYSPGFNENNHDQCPPTDAESIASIYGYPIDKWDVSNVHDFACVFERKCNFDEPIGSWDVSNATSMRDMFAYARTFNQDLSYWNVSNVRNMSFMFISARSFNQDLSSWDVSNVTLFRLANSCRDGKRLITWIFGMKLPWFKKEMIKF